MLRFLRGRAGDVHARLNDMDRVYHIGIGFEVVVDAGDRLGIGQQPLHFGFCTAVAELQVVQHRVVLLGKALIRRLDHGHIRAHFVGVVGHICNCHVGVFDCFFGIAAEGLNQACGERGDRLHVLVCRQTGRFVGVGGVALQFLGVVLEQRIHAAHQLLIIGVGGDNFLAQLDSGGPGSGGDCTHCRADALEDAAQLFKLAAGFFCLLPSIVDLTAHVPGVFCGVVHLIRHLGHRLLRIRIAVAGFGERVVVGFQFALHVVEGGFRIVQLDLPALGAAVVFLKGLRRIFQRLPQHLDFLLLRIDLLVQNLRTGGDGLHGGVVFAELGRHQFHLRAENFEGLVDVRNGLFELLFALKTDFQAEIVCHTAASFPRRSYDGADRHIDRTIVVYDLNVCAILAAVDNLAVCRRVEVICLCRDLDMDHRAKEGGHGPVCLAWDLDGAVQAVGGHGCFRMIGDCHLHDLGVYDRHLAQKVRELRQCGIPRYGDIFGHQPVPEHALRIFQPRDLTFNAHPQPPQIAARASSISEVSDTVPPAV